LDAKTLNSAFFKKSNGAPSGGFKSPTLDASVGAGALVGLDAGALVGLNAGALVGLNAGAFVGLDAGALVGLDAGALVGLDAGALVASGALVDAGALPPQLMMLVANKIAMHKLEYKYFM